MSEVQSELDQLRLDLDEANLRLERLRKAIEERDGAEANVRQLAAELRRAKRLAKEAGWNVGSLLARERRPEEPAGANGRAKGKRGT